ncbi:acyl--CoA ligase [Acidiferrimicrobium sp. IK]|uniref:class I adenylate-forming enzyme family protein n=1 Tax=Acidiferrimicrobium sp. IK TaxID=2871700 RepID=UPI0021CB83EC|nr:class I adenylate-forming enzyme family protein [Acidiferrimicrobium sp. IK]MCU4184624.1 acyl--CoA ligase [Acidiferrimicrobium sp. IK]
MPRLTDQLLLMAEHLGDQTGFVDLGSGGRLTFERWAQGGADVAAGLARLGVVPGERVALHLPLEDPIRWVVAYAGIHMAGAVAVPLNPRLVGPELTALLGHAEVSVALTGGPGASVLLGVAPSLPTLRHVIVGGEPVAARAGAATVLRWEEAVAPGAPFPTSVPADEDDIADIVYTSGTTGRPKGVVVRHANSSLIPNGLPAWNGSGWLTSSPLFTFAGITAVYNPMKLGMVALYLPRFDAKAWIEAVERERPSMVFLVPAMAELLLADPGFATADLSSIGLAAVGSAPLAPDTWRRLQARMPAAAVSNAYGMTEAGPAFTVLPKEEAERRVGSVGRPLPPAEFFVVGKGGERLAAGEVGELVIRLPGRPREYYRDPEATAAVWHEDGLHTGDLARLDDDGYVYIVGRTKEVIIRGGNNVYAGDVEAVLYEHPAVAEATVAGVPHPVLGEDVAAWVVAAPDAIIDPVGLRDWSAERLAPHKVPRHITVVASLPRNATGKVVRTQLPPAAEPLPRLSDRPERA